LLFEAREGRPERDPQTHRRSSLPQSFAYRTLLSAPGSLTPQSYPTSASLDLLLSVREDYLEFSTARLSAPAIFA
jgi:hypothetical protein